MRRISCFVLLALLSMSVSIYAAARRPVDVWNHYYFNGTAFVVGTPENGSFVAVRDKARPVLSRNASSAYEVSPLPDGTGVIAGICYLGTTGGKVGGSVGYVPYQRVPLLISSGGKPFLTVQTDENGYFFVVLAAGTYMLGSPPFTADIVVERGVTTLVPLQAGKRMVD